MAKFDRYDFVKFTEQAQRCLHKKPNTMLVMGFEEKEGKTTYELFDMYSFETYAEQEEEWLEGAPSPICQMTLLPTSGLTVKDSENQTIGKGLSTVSILGATYTIQELSVSEDISLKDCDGYCDRTDKRIVIAKKEADCDLGDFEQHRKKTMRHEIIHAYFNESGLAENFENKCYGIPETLVDWFAIQSPKIYKTFAELDIL